MTPADAFAALVGNKAVEDAAIAWVLGLELAAGRQPLDRRYEAAFAADIDSPPRVIEVKAVGGNRRGWFVPLEEPQYLEADRSPSFYLYVVDNVRQRDLAKFRLKVSSGERLARLVERGKLRRYYEVPIPVAEFDMAPGLEAGKP